MSKTKNRLNRIEEGWEEKSEGKTREEKGWGYTRRRKRVSERGNTQHANEMSQLDFCFFHEFIHFITCS